MSRAVSVDRYSAGAHCSLGCVLHDLERVEEALASYDGALTIEPNYAEALYNRGNALRDLKRPTEALASYDRALQLKPGYAPAHWNQALCRLGERHRKGA